MDACAKHDADSARRYGLLDAWRGVACLMVVWHHAAYALDWDEGAGSWARWLTYAFARHCDQGVALFFVISGYCIAASLDAHRRSGRGAARFLVKRLWRIYPPYWSAMVGFALVIGALELVGADPLFRGPRGVELSPLGALDWRQWVGNLTLTETWRPHVWGPTRDVFTAVAWSLCFEEQFYAIALLVLWLAPDRLTPGLLVVTATVGVLRIGAWWFDGLGSLRGTFPLLWHQFAVGLAVYFRLMSKGRRVGRIVDGGLASLFVAAVMSGGTDTAFSASFGLLLVATHSWDTRADSWRWLEPLRACGRRCYSIYLVHLPVTVIGNNLLFDLGLTSFWARVLLTMPLVSVLGVAAGWTFHELVERQFLGPPPLPSARRARLARELATDSSA